MDRRSFLKTLGIGAGALIITPSIIKASLLDKPPEPGDKDWTVIIENGIWDQSKIYLRIVNTNEVAVPVVLFGSSLNLIENNNIPAGVNISVGGGTYEALLKSIWDQPIRILGLKYKAKTPDQLRNPIELTHFNEKYVTRDNLYLGMGRQLKVNQALQKCTTVDMPSFGLLLTKNTYVSTIIDAHEDVEMIFDLPDLWFFKTVYTVDKNGNHTSKPVTEFVNAKSLR
jgi:hypothetical protein